MISGVAAYTSGFLADLNATQTRIGRENSEISSGFAVQQASDDPGAISSILDYQQEISRVTQVQTNLNNASTVASTADAALQSVSQILDQVTTIAAQGATTTSSATTNMTLGNQVEQLEQQLVSIANTSVQGQYIFGGDTPETQPYTFNWSSPKGVVAADNLNFSINGGPEIQVSVNQSASRSLAQIASDLNANTSFSAAATASVNAGGNLVIQSNTAGTGTVEVFANALSQQVGLTVNSTTNNTSSAGASLVGTSTAAVDTLPTSTTTIENANGSTIVPSMTAQQIFDAQDANGNPTAGNVFNALYSLGTALQTNNQAGIQNAISMVKSASQQISQTSVFYGDTENWISSANSDASQRLTDLQSALSTVRDANIPAVASQLTLDETALNASISAQATLNNTKSLFDYLG
jgi:flagellar hook-associated protein 3 FlgL